MSEQVTPDPLDAVSDLLALVKGDIHGRSQRKGIIAEAEAVLAAAEARAAARVLKATCSECGYFESTPRGHHPGCSHFVWTPPFAYAATNPCAHSWAVGPTTGERVCFYCGLREPHGKWSFNAVTAFADSEA